MKKKLTESNKLLILSLLVGVLTGFAAVILLEGIHLVQHILYPDTLGEKTVLWHNFVLPGLGMLVSLLIVRYLVRDDIGHGVTKVLQAVSSNDSFIKPHNTFSSVITSIITIGAGGSVGAEAPIVYTGAAIGSNIGRKAGLSYRSVTTLVCCGAAGAVAGIFKAPLAGVLFTVEILFFSITLGSMMPLLISTVSSTVVAYIFTGVHPSFQCSLEVFKLGNIPYYIIFGVLCGLMSLFFTRSTLSLEDRLGKMANPWAKWALCAVGLGLSIFLFPPLYGEGYDCIKLLLNGQTYSSMGVTPLGFLTQSSLGMPVFFLFVMFMKVISMTLTNAGGGVGGTFGPTLFVGAIAGFVFSRFFNLSINFWQLPEQNFVLVGMAGLMAGVMQAPMTAIFLIAEITGGYDLLLPLIAVSTVSFGVTRIWEKYSIYTKRIAQRGELLTHDNDQAVLTLLHTRDLVRDKYPRLDLSQTLGEIMPIVSDSVAQVFPVLDSGGRFQGLVDMDDLRKHMFHTESYDTIHVYNMMVQPLAYVDPDEPLDHVLDKFEHTGAWRLPVVDKDRHYLGFISKSRILTAYREELKAITGTD